MRPGEMKGEQLSMKRAKSKFLSLLLVLVMALAMVPSAAAYYNGGYYDPSYPGNSQMGYGYVLTFSNGGSSATMNLRVGQTSGVPSFQAYFYNPIIPNMSRPLTDFTYSGSGAVSVDSNGMVTGLQDGYGSVSISCGGIPLGSVTVYVGKYQGQNPSTPDLPSGGNTLTNQTVRVTVGANAGAVSFSTAGQNTPSIYDQIVAAVASYEGYYPGYYPNQGYNGLRGSYTVSVSPASGSSNVATLNGASSAISLQSLASLSLTIKQYGTWQAYFTVTDTRANKTAVSGSILVDVSQYSGRAISYTGSLGSPVTLNVSDFDTFWSEISGTYGRLESVTFNGITGLSGTLCYGHSYAETSHRSAIGSTFYTGNYGYNQYPLRDLTFFPAPSYNNTYPTGTATIAFTATGTVRNSYNSTTSTQTVKGTINILYNNGAVSAIVCPVVNGVGMLKVADFDAVYRQAVNNSYITPSYTVQFTKLPTMGTLYYNYNGSNGYYGQSYGTAISYANMNTQFSNQPYSTYSLANVAYVADRGVAGTNVTDTATFAIYNGSSLLATGTINFGGNGTVGTNVSYVSSGAPVQFKSRDFFPNSSSMRPGEYIVFGYPSSGSLYRNYSNGYGTPVTSSNRFSYAASTISQTESIETVTYVPQAGFNGTVEIPYYLYNSYGSTSTRGTVTIKVSTVKFSDVSSSDWYSSYVSELVAANIVGGYEDGSFRPNGNVTNGEALKLILKAAGYSDQSRTDKHWASGYLSAAYRDGIVSSAYLDLDAPITRNAFVSMAAKALKIPPVTYGASPFADSKDPYALALYNTIVSGERIIGGTTQNGLVYFNGGNNIRRSEMSKIICLMYRYKNTGSTPVTPNYPNTSGPVKYVLDLSTHVFHYPNCSRVPYGSSRYDLEVYRSAVTDMGYTPCPYCHP